ncbi:hypothetical protein C8R48DRAFT_596419 [Suillus tomentosus]|nr:hypothetical protein C8R48DRAFT_596419 [Suillus tomentosus]KAG2057148.1 hypothetical protein BDR06DRAFT_878941 [Suillus hirtellus]
MVRVCNRALTDFCHNHLGIQIHHGPQSHALETERVESSSGPARTHPCLADLKPTIVGPRVEHKDEFTCKGGVDAGRLVNLARKGLYSTAKEMGGNVLLEEKSAHPLSLYQRRDQFKVTIHYSATVARSCWPDAQRPVEIEAAKGIKGLMTVIDRHPEF